MPTGEPAGSTPNVGLFGEAIKGKGGECPAVRRTDELGLRPEEE